MVNEGRYRTQHQEEWGVPRHCGAGRLVRCLLLRHFESSAILVDTGRGGVRVSAMRRCGRSTAGGAMRDSVDPRDAFIC